MRYLFKPWYLRWALSIIGILLSAEVGVRALGFVDFPLYDANSTIGYVPSANQQGSFMNRNHWQFNAQHMEALPFAPTAGADLLLIGDSLVYGGNSYRESERLGPALQARLRQASQAASVWPVGAGSWSLRNELIWLKQNPEVVQQIDRIVFVLNSSDFDEASSWSCELTHPRNRPAVALWYLFNKYLHSFTSCGMVPAELQVPLGDLNEELRNFMTSEGEKTVFVLYPNHDEFVDPELRAADFRKASGLLQAVGASEIVDVAEDAQWHLDYYKDSIHPTAEGNRALAGIIFSALGPAAGPSR